MPDGYVKGRVAGSAHRKGHTESTVLNVQVGKYPDPLCPDAMLFQRDAWVKEGHKIKQWDRVEYREGGTSLKWFPAGRQTPITLEQIPMPEWAGILMS